MVLINTLHILQGREPANLHLQHQDCLSVSGGRFRQATTERVGLDVSGGFGNDFHGSSVPESGGKTGSENAGSDRSSTEWRQIQPNWIHATNLNIIVPHLTSVIYIINP